MAVVGYVAANLVFLALGRAGLPFQLPATFPNSLGYQLVNHVVQLVEALLIIAIAYVITRGNAVSSAQLVGRAPACARAAAETAGMVAYAVLAQAGGWAVGSLLGLHPLSLHLPGTLYGLTTVVAPREVYAWSIYNFVMYAVIPYAYFRLMGYSNGQLSLRSTNRRRDVMVIGVVLLVEAALELAYNHSIFTLSPSQLLGGVPVSFVVHLFGTVLPIMVFIYAILLPRYLRLTGSAVATVILGGLTYAALHTLDPWAVWAGPRDAALSLLFVFFQYFGPGMVKSVLTLRTGNAWVHAFAYHAIAPHVTLDTPNIVRILGIR